MKIWFGCTTAEWETYREHYFQIRNYLLELNCILIHDWILNAEKVYQSKTKRKRGADVYQFMLEAINQCDAVVIEHTVPNFSTAHQITYALQRQKPILVMRLHKDKTIFADSYLESLHNPLLTVSEYTTENYQEIIKRFLKINEIKNGFARYNLVLTHKHKYYLDWCASEFNQSRSELVRDALDLHMAQNQKYKTYLEQ
jgi:nucleoside 2-deoxyribosyltransferase